MREGDPAILNVVQLYFITGPCPYESRNSLEDGLRRILNELGVKRPGISWDFLRGLVRNADLLEVVSNAGDEGANARCVVYQ